MTRIALHRAGRAGASTLRITGISLLQLALLACASPAQPTDDAAAEAAAREDAAQEAAADAARDSAPDAAVVMDSSADSAPADTGVPEDTGAADSGPMDTGVAMDSGIVMDSGVVMDTGVDSASDVRTDSGCRAVCSGACVDTLTNTQHCGSCGNVCPVPMNGAATCELGLCAISCSPGYAPNGARCDPLPVPRLMAPLSGQWVTSATPTLRWQNNGASNGARVQVCRDPACVTVITQFDSILGSSGQPTVALTPGVWFWRAFPLSGTVVGPSASATWSFVVQQRPAVAYDGTTHQQFDADNDGSPDLLVLATPDPASGPMEMQLVYTRSASFVQQSAPLRREANLSRPIAVGDVNGDGRSDALIRAAAGGCLYLGTPTGMTLDACSSASSGTLSYEYSQAAGAGDVNGDGYADVLVPSGNGTLFVRYGSATGLGAPRDEFVLPRDSGASVARFAVGDFNGDRQRELVVIRTTGSGLQNPMVIPIVAGVPSDGGRRALSWGTLGISPWIDINPVATDVNGDGRQDLVVALRSNDFPRRGGRLVVFLGSTTGLAAMPSQLIAHPDGDNDLFGAAFDRVGDVNGDGAEDVVVTSPAYSSNTGRAYLYLGGASGLSSAPAQQFDGASAGGYFGQAIVGLGPTQRDRAVGFAISAFYAPTPGTTRGALSLFVSNGSTVLTPAASTANNNGMTTGYGYRMSSISH